MTIFGIDISNNNGPDVDLAKVKAEGFDFVFAKVSEGTYFRDSTWTHYRDAAKGNGLLVAGYHYLIDGQVEAQADLFLDQLGDPTCPIMIDFEANSGGMANFWGFVNAVNARGREVALSYVPEWYAQQIGGDVSKVPGWIQSSYVTGVGYASALYPGDGDGRWAPFQGRTPDILQFTDRAMVAGKAVDANAFRGTRDQLAQLLGATPLPPPGPAPFEYPSTDRMVLEVWEQLRGPKAGGWTQLGGLPLVDAVAAIGQHLGIPGFTPPTAPHA